MPRFLKSFHLITLSLGFLAIVALIFNLGIFAILYPQVTQLVEFDPSWESYGVVAAINIITIAIFQLCGVCTLLAHMIIQKKTSTLVILAIVTGIISGLMVLSDITLLSDIGKEYAQGWQTRGEWKILFNSYGLHILSLVLAMVSIIKNLRDDKKPAEQVMKDEVLFLSLHTTGLICGGLGLLGVVAGLFSDLSLWMMERIVVVMGLIVLSPYLVILGIWIFRRNLGGVTPGLDEKQFQDLATAGLWTLIFTLPLMLLFFGLQLSSLAKESWSALWLPLLVFSALISFSSLTLRYFREYR
jgi:hypothetical protein